ncbi:phosphoribosylformimino-5-aminoimidazole carboxamide ribotide isomerase [Desulfosarcina sp. OttesenSCG-928-A07]|nr:phosphoribosylformimino-5-aminoimidazole carboxamide ribotide isomerase [Desulfosarcina sp. OttesenSCG-928-A07]
MRFRPCIDLHAGVVKQIVGGTLSDHADASLKINFEATKPADWFARLYHRDNLSGGHVIQLGPGNTNAAKSALSAWPGGLQIGGGIDIDNAPGWLDAGASHVIVTSWVFDAGRIHMDRLSALSRKIGKNRLVLDLSCRRSGNTYVMATNRWQTLTDEAVNAALMDRLSAFCDEFLIHAVDVEGRCAGIETELVTLLGKWQKIPITYAGGIAAQKDIDTIEALGSGHIDFTVGSSLDIFGGTGLCYAELAKRYGPSRIVRDSGEPS